MARSAALADRIDDDALAQMPGDDHRLPVQERLCVRCRAPQHLVSESRLALGGVEMAPDRRVNAVSADQNVRAVHNLAARAVAKSRDDAIAVLVCGHERRPAVKTFGAEAL